MKRTHASAILIFVLILLLLPAGGSTAPEADDPAPPALVVLENIMPGDWDNPMGKRRLLAKRDLPLYREKDVDSEVVATLAAGEFALIVTNDVHCYPRESAVAVTRDKPPFGRGDMFYILEMRGEGAIIVWHKGKVIYWVNTSGINPEIYRHYYLSNPAPQWAELIGTLPHTQWWIKLRAPNGAEGWRILDREDYQSGRIYLWH